jgi:antagonist of KipI
MGIHIIDSGLLTTVQDLGRWGFQKDGVSVSGVMDSFASRIANWLVGNEEHEATLEVTMVGPTLRFEENVLIAICGGEFSCTLNDQPVSLWKPLFVKSGSVLSIGACRSGYRAYIAFAGGFDIPMVMNSRSTYLQANLGGFNGRALQKGDVLSLRSNQFPVSARDVRWGISYSFRSYFSGKRKTIRVMEGPEFATFTEKSRYDFFASPYEVTVQSNRMGYRLKGKKLERKTDEEMISEAVTFGTIQVPRDGQPIILMADRQTTGGYPRIAQVISVDLPILAQARPREVICFQKVTFAEAQRLYMEREREMKTWKKIIEWKWRENR